MAKYFFLLIVCAPFMILHFQIIKLYMRRPVAHVEHHTQATWLIGALDRKLRWTGKHRQINMLSIYLGAAIASVNGCIHICTQICYNGRGRANSLVLISQPHKPCDLFCLCPGCSIYCHRSTPPTCK